jgi:hypothetical protein
MSDIPATTRRAEIEGFLKKSALALNTRGRLIFALDATASRQPSWDTACALQAQMFDEVATIGIDVQLVYFRGSECQASSWVSNARALAALMEKIHCRTGYTQIGKVLAHTQREHDRQKVRALVFVGDAMEEKAPELYGLADELGRRSVPAFMFQEGDDPDVTKTFKEIARLTQGAYCRFDPGAAHELAELLRAVAAYAAGGLKALSSRKGALLQQLTPSSDRP